MAIGFVTEWNERGAGYVARAYAQVLGLEEKVHIYHRGSLGLALDKDITSSLNVNYYRAASPIVKRYCDINLQDMEKWIKINHISVILFNEQHFWKPVVFCKHLGVRIGAYIDYYLPETVPFFRLYDFLICNTKRHHSVFSWHPHCFYIPWGTNIDIFKPHSLSLVDADKVTFFHSAGSVPYRKGTDLLLRAFNGMPKEGCRLIIHSQLPVKCFDKYSRRIIEKEISNNSLSVIEGTVIAPGLYHRGNVYVYPSRLDGIGLSVSEALGCGLPVITSNEPPMNEFVPEGCGRLVKIEKRIRRFDNYYWPQAQISVDDLRRNMYFFVENVKKLPEFKANALKYAQQNLDWSRNAVHLLDIFRNVNASGNEFSRLINTINSYEYPPKMFIRKSYRRVLREFQKMRYGA